jgi:hypothetical protein
MKYKLLYIATLTLSISLLLFTGIASADAFNPNDVIDDGTFDNTNSMSVSQIDAFLNSQPNSCISTGSGFDAIDPTGYSPSSGFTFGGFTTAGQVIFDSANAYGLNPQVLLATLQKEQGLVSGGTSNFCNSDGNMYAAAAGYGCPDSGSSYYYSNVNLYERNGQMVTSVGPTCVNSVTKVGFSQQVIHSAWLLKFGEQRSQGNVNWEVVKGNWDNSDDPQSCYGGPMTQGTWAVCPSGASAYYDGYTTIDGTSVHMDNGATAALYWYTPHLSGNTHFFNIFTEWFGSTTYTQPLASKFVVGNQSGKLYFISLSNNTYYFVPTWSTAQAFGLDHYQVMPMDDSVIDSYTNGGTLKTLVWNNDDQKLYLVDGNRKIWFQQYCAQWGLDCTNQKSGDVTFLTSTYFDDVLPNGGESQPLQANNGTLYLMQNGTKEPFANTTSLLDLGYNGNQISFISQGDLNSNQPLGNLQITTPTFIQFLPSTQLLLFDGVNYHFVPSYDMYQSWGQPGIMIPPQSSYNNTPPSLSDNLSYWEKSSTNKYYFIDFGHKVDVSSNPSNWYTGTFQTSVPDSALNGLPTVAAQPFINIAGSVYAVQSAFKRHVPSYDDYLWLGINQSDTLNVGSNIAIPNGVDILRDGAFFTVQGNQGLYITNGSISYHLPSATVANDFGIDWSSIRTNLNANVLSSGYPSSTDLSRWVTPSGTSNLIYIANKTQITTNAQSIANWGINPSSQNPSSVDLALLFNVSGSQALGQFVRDETTGKVYYGSGGTYHYVASYSTFISLGGSVKNLINVYPDFFSTLTQGSTYN